MSIISRFGIALRDRDWGTAAIDVCIVAIGILMALTVDDWRSERDRKKREHEAFQRAHQEISHAEGVQSGENPVYLERLDALYEARRLVFEIPPDRSLTRDECESLVQSYLAMIPNYPIAAIRELYASGQNSAVRDPEVVRAAIKVVDEIEHLSSVAKVHSGTIENLSREFPDLVSVRMRIADDPDDRDGLVPSGDCDLDGMRLDREFGAALNEVINYQMSVIEPANGYLARDLKSLHRILDNRLGIKHP